MDTIGDQRGSQHVRGGAYLAAPEAGHEAGYRSGYDGGSEPGYEVGHDGAGYDGAGYDGGGYDGAGYDGAGYDGAGYAGAGYGGAGYDGAGYDGAGHGAVGYPVEYEVAGDDQVDDGVEYGGQYGVQYGGGHGHGPVGATRTPTLAPDQRTTTIPVAPRMAPDDGVVTGSGADRRAGVTSAEEQEFNLQLVLEHMLAVGASDLHLAAGSPPLARVDGQLGTLDGFGDLSASGIQQAVYAILTQRQRERFEAELELDLAYALVGKARFRVNLYRQREAIGAAFRKIPYEIKSLEDLGMPPAVAQFAALPRGMVLVTGPTGSGKSTTLAALVDLANRTRHDHILTIEDPIEFLHRHKGCLVNQREVGEDTHSFANALRHALRQDPDIVLVGEMRDLETISVALTAAETGHLVFATLHTQDAAQTIDRIVDVFPPHQQQQVRTQLAGVLQGVVCQTLCPRASGSGRVAAVEVLVATPAIRNLVREGKTHQIYSALQSGGQYGMHTLDQHLAGLVRQRIITRQVALEVGHHAEDLQRLIGGQ